MTTKLIPGAIAFVLGLAAAGGAALAGGIPTAAPVMSYSGVLRNGEGKPLAETEKTFQLKLWSSATATGDPLCATPRTDIETDNLGHFSVPLDDCVDAVKANADVYIEVIVNTVSLGTTKLGVVPYALETAHAVTADTANTANTANSANSANTASTANTANTAGGELANQLGSLGSRLTAVEQRAPAGGGGIGGCVTRTVSGNYQTGSTWMPQTVCQANEIAISAGGFCSTGGTPTGARMIGVSTTSGSTDGQVWLWCSQTTQAIWYGMCCSLL
jgi:hypothetical protein